jgi:hypothetical protein
MRLRISSFFPTSIRGGWCVFFLSLFLSEIGVSLLSLRPYGVVVYSIYLCLYVYGYSLDIHTRASPHLCVGSLSLYLSYIFVDNLSLVVIHCIYTPL